MRERRLRARSTARTRILVDHAGQACRSLARRVVSTDISTHRGRKIPFLHLAGRKIAGINPFRGKAPLWAVEELSPMEVRSSSRHRRMPIKSRGRKESPIDRRRLAFPFLAPSRRFSFSCSFSFPFTLPTRVAEATEAKGCPNWEVGIMGRINMQGLDTCGGRRWRRRSSRRMGG